MTSPSGEPHTVTVALAGQPNVGKSTVFNLLTGLSQHVGNWPGKTIEQKVGVHHFRRNGDSCAMRIVDLPGAYSLTANSLEEQLARDFIIAERPDAVAVIADAASLERSLYLLAEFLFLPVPVVLGLNMTDVAEQHEIHISPRILEAALGVPVVPMSATKNQGVRELVEAVDRVIRGELPYAPNRPAIREDHRTVLQEIRALIAGRAPAPYPEEWVALKLLEGDGEVARMMEARMPGGWEAVQAILTQHEDAMLAVASGRYEWIGRIVRAAVTRPRTGQITLTDRLDRIATHPVWGILLLLGLLGVVFWLTYRVGAPLQELLDAHLVQTAAEWLRGALEGAPWWVTGLLADGIVTGGGMVVTFLPILLVFFGILGLLEDVGYMARAAFVMDRFMHLIGLHGKSFIPMCIGFGCNVPAIMGVRIIESRKARLLTMFLTPFIPCTARLAVLTFIAAAIFGTDATWVVWSLVTMNILVLGLVGMTAHAFFMKEEPTPFIMELPLYHQPEPKTIAMVVWSRMVAFIKKAGTVILAVSVLVWLLAYFPNGETETSFLAAIGRFTEPLGRPLGLDWKMMTALLTSIVAKENAVATLGVLYGVGDQGLIEVLPKVMGHASALAFLTVVMLFVPCAATVIVMKREMNDRTWFYSSIVMTLVLSYLGGIAAYRIALWAGF